MTGRVCVCVFMTHSNIQIIQTVEKSLMSTSFYYELPEVLLEKPHRWKKRKRARRALRAKKNKT